MASAEPVRSILSGQGAPVRSRATIDKCRRDPNDTGTIQKQSGQFNAAKDNASGSMAIGTRAMTLVPLPTEDDDLVWTRIRNEAEDMARHEPLLAGFVQSSILHHASLDMALAFRFSLKLASGEMSEQLLRDFAEAAHREDPCLGDAARADIIAVFDRDPACHTFCQPILFFKGFQALQCYRIANYLWNHDRRDIALYIQMRVSEVFGVDIHPAAVIGSGILIDHAHSIVIGETAAVGDNVSMLHSVTLGGTGKEDGDRHPKIGSGVLLGAGAKILGNITIGECSRVAAGSVVLNDVPRNKTVAGIPARIVGEAGCSEPSETMDQYFHPSA